MGWLKKAYIAIVVERRLPWRLEQWLNRQSLVVYFRDARYQRRERRLFSHFVKPDDLVFDIGANVGNKAQVFLELGTRVVCVEPDTRSLAILNEKFSGNAHVTIVDTGVGSQLGEAKFHPSPSSSRSTFDVSRMEQLGDDCCWEAGEVVRITTLDLLIEEFGVPQFCKIDVEGFESAVIEGLTSTIPILSFEFHGELIDDVRTCVDRLDFLGMSYFNVLLYPVGRRQPFHPLDRLYLQHRVTKSELLSTLASLSHETLAGDIYAFAS